MQNLRRLLPSAGNLVIFESAGRLLSFTAAALELGMTQAAVSYSIRNLEAQIGVPLFFRAHRRVGLTEAGQRFHADVTLGLSHIRKSAEAIAAVKSFDALQQETVALVNKRSSLSKAADQLAAFDEIQSEGVRALDTVGLLTRALPDDTSLLNLQIQGSKVRLSGQTPNTADLMQKLSAYPGLRDVKAPAAATRPLGTSTESFSIELELAPEVFQASIVSPAESASAATNSVAASAPAQKASAP